MAGKLQPESDYQIAEEIYHKVQIKKDRKLQL